MIARAMPAELRGGCSAKGFAVSLDEKFGGGWYTCYVCMYVSFDVVATSILWVADCMYPLTAYVGILSCVGAAASGC